MCKGDRIVFFAFDGEYIGNHRHDDMDYYETCDNCSNGVVEACERCVNLIEDKDIIPPSIVTELPTV